MLAARIRVIPISIVGHMCLFLMSCVFAFGQTANSVSPSTESDSISSKTELGLTAESRTTRSSGNFGNDEISQLIQQLRSRSFSERQAATEQLWNLGPRAIESLKQSLDDPDPEVAKRIQGLIEALEYGVDASTPRATALMVLYFKNGETEVREQIIRNLVLQDNYRLIFDLLDDLENADERRQLYDEGIELNSTIFRLALGEKWEIVNDILTHDIAWEFDPQLCLFHALAQGSFENKLDEFKVRVSEYEAKQVDSINNIQPATPVEQDDTSLKPPKSQRAKNQFDQNVLMVIRMLRMTNRRDEAIAYARRVADPVLRLQLIHGMEMEMGYWSAVSSRLVVKEEQPPGDETSVVARQEQIALAKYFAGDQEQFTQAISRLKEQVAMENGESKNDADLRLGLLNVMLATMSWKDAADHLEQMNREDAFRLCIFLQRNDEALELIGLSDDVEQRLIWFRRLTNRLDSIFKQFARIAGEQGIQRLNKQIGLPAADGDSIDSKALAVFDLGVTAAAHLGSLGFTDEAIYHLRSIADTILPDSPGASEKRGEILVSLIEAGATGEAWQLVQDRYQENEYRDAFRYMFRFKIETFEFWYEKLKDDYPNPLSRARSVASIINSPLKPDAEPVDLNSLFSRVDGDLSNSNSSLRGSANYHLAMTLFYHGDFANSRRYMEAAAREGNFSARSHLAEIAMESGDNLLAFRFFEQLWRRSISSTTTTFSAWAAAECCERLGDVEKAKQRRLVAVAAWLESYRHEQILDHFEHNKKVHWLADILNLSVYGSPDSSTTNEIDRRWLATAQETKSSSESAINWQIYLYNGFASNRTGNPIAIADIAGRTQLNLAAAALDDGNPELAGQLLVNFNEFRPGDPEIGERLIPVLDGLGETKQAEDLFQMVAHYYRQTLIRYPDSPLHHNNYGWFCASCKRGVDFAFDHATAAVNLRPGNSSYLDTLAELNYLGGNVQAARDLSRECLRIQPTKRHYLKQFLRFDGKL